MRANTVDFMKGAIMENDTAPLMGKIEFQKIDNTIRLLEALVEIKYLLEKCPNNSRLNVKIKRIVIDALENA